MQHNNWLEECKYNYPDAAFENDGQVCFVYFDFHYETGPNAKCNLDGPPSWRLTSKPLCVQSVRCISFRKMAKKLRARRFPFNVQRQLNWMGEKGVIYTHTSAGCFDGFGRNDTYKRYTNKPENRSYETVNTCWWL